VDTALIQLASWVELKKQEISALTKSEIASARSKAYGGAGMNINVEIKYIFISIYRFGLYECSFKFQKSSTYYKNLWVIDVSVLDNPVKHFCDSNFLAACVIIPILCPMAYSIAAGVTEGNVKEIQKGFDKGINQINTMKTEINAMRNKTTQLIGKVRSDNKKLVIIYAKLDDANTNAGFALKIDFTIFFEPFKEAVTALYKFCQGYSSE